jgi:hypothetical protein
MDRTRPVVVAQSSRSCRQASRRSAGSSERISNRTVAAVELRLDVRHDLDPVHHEIGDQAVDLSVLHDHADQPSSTQVALAEFCADEVLVVEASHADRLGRPHTERATLPLVGHADERSARRGRVHG